MNKSRPIALVTGASSGIGTELALELAKAGHDLILTGRDAQRLADAAARVQALGATVETLTLDLAQPDAVVQLTTLVGDRPLAVLVNNAGFGGSGLLAEADGTHLAAMIGLNVTILTLLTRAFLPGMVSRRQGRILNVASTASFGPVPTMAVYGATKAYVLSFSAAVAEEVAASGVTVTALCPGATATRFAERADLGARTVFQTAMSAEEVARQGVRALLRGKRTKVTGLKNVVMAFSTRFAPRSLAARIAGQMMSSRTH